MVGPIIDEIKIIEKYVGKGKEVAIEGKLTTRSWEDKDGVKRYSTVILTTSIKIIEL